MRSKRAAAHRDGTKDDYFGTVVGDPYRWLEDVDSPQTRAWVKAESALTRSYLDAIPARAAIKSSFAKLLDYARGGVPVRAGDRWFTFRNSGLQNQDVLYVATSDVEVGDVFLDPNALSDDGTVALASVSFTRDGRLMAYSTQSAGSDWLTWRVRDVASGADLPDIVRWSKFCDAAWLRDKGFYYSRYDEPTDANQTLATLGVQRVCFHTLGTAQSADSLVFASTEHPDEFVHVKLTEDERLVFLDRRAGAGGGNAISWKHAEDPETAYRPLFDLDPEISYEIVGDDGNRLYVLTNLDAPQYRVASVDLDDPAHALHDLAPESADRLDAVSLVGDRFYLSYLHDAHSVVRIVDLEGTDCGEIALPGLGTVGLPVAKRWDPVAYYSFTSYTQPPTVYRLEARTSRSSFLRTSAIGFDRDAFVTDLLFTNSKDGTRVPVFVTHRKDMPHDGSTPTILHGYGGFNVSNTPVFTPDIALWLQMGGAYASAVLRGGGEYGKRWHDAGRLGRKQNVFDDFIAAAQSLVDASISSTQKLAIKGGSNGGLLVGAVLTQRPELFGAAIPEAGVLDLLRYQRWTIGKAWIPELGDATASAEAFGWLHAYSPVHNAGSRTIYPPTLVMTSDHDDRVHPAHSFKFAAAMQHAQEGDAPILLRVDTKAGHGAGRPTDKYVDEVADGYAFLVAALAFGGGDGTTFGQGRWP